MSTNSFFRTTARLLCFTILLGALSACNDDDDDGTGNGTGSTPITRTEEVVLVFQGNTQEANAINVDFISSPQTLEITGVFPSGDEMEIGMQPIPAIGSHGTTIGLALGFSSGQSAWFCNENCTVQIQEHDTGARWIRLRVTGTVSDLFGQNTAQLSEARFAVFY